MQGGGLIRLSLVVVALSPQLAVSYCAANVEPAWVFFEEIGEVGMSQFAQRRDMDGFAAPIPCFIQRGPLSGRIVYVPSLILEQSVRTFDAMQLVVQTEQFRIVLGRVLYNAAPILRRLVDTIRACAVPCTRARRGGILDFGWNGSGYLLQSAF